MTKEYVTVRLKSEDVKTIDQLVRAGATVSRSQFIRDSVKARISEYTGEPNLHNIYLKVVDLENRINVLEAKI